MANNSDAMKKRLEAIHRKLQYKDLIDLGSRVNDKLETTDTLETFNNILHIVNTCETLSAAGSNHGTVENALIDVQILKMSHDLIGSTAEKIGKCDFTDHEYSAGLLNLMTIDYGYENFDSLGEHAIKCCKTSRFLLPMLGTFEYDEGMREEKPKKERQARIKKTVHEKTAPEAVGKLQKKDKGAEKINAVRSEMQRVCRERNTDTIPYFEFIVHPKDFMKTVDNAFQVSFLVRDSIVGLKNDNSEPFLYLYDCDPMVNPSQHEETESVQCVLSLTPKIWKQNIKKYNIKKPLMITASSPQDMDVSDSE
ncbi:unnamed protein product [Diamesa serratosioi]